MCESDLGREHSRAQGLTPNSRASPLLQDLIEAAERRSGHCTGMCRCREAQARIVPDNPFAFPPSLEVRCARATLAANTEGTDSPGEETPPPGALVAEVHDAGIEDLRDDLQRLDEARPGPVEKVMTVGGVDAMVADGFQRRPPVVL